MKKWMFSFGKEDDFLMFLGILCGKKHWRLTLIEGKVG